MSVRYEIITKNGTYKDKQTGEDKQSWLKVGVLMDTRNGGQAIKIDYLPPMFDGWLNLREPKAKDAPAVKQEAPQTQQNDLDDDPF